MITLKFTPYIYKVFFIKKIAINNKKSACTKIGKSSEKTVHKALLRVQYFRYTNDNMPTSLQNLIYKKFIKTWSEHGFS